MNPTGEDEQYVAAVWYVMNEAKRVRRITHGRRGFGKWFFLTKVLKQLGLEQQHVSYVTMRRELQEFAATFGLEGDDVPASPQNIAAMEEFRS
jgi:hypothetical protein